MCQTKLIVAKTAWSQPREDIRPKTARDVTTRYINNNNNTGAVTVLEHRRGDVIDFDTDVKLVSFGKSEWDCFVLLLVGDILDMAVHLR